MRKVLVILFAMVLTASCRRLFEAPVPDLNWDLFNAADARLLTGANIRKLAGIYNISEGADHFGGNTAAKWSYTALNNDTTYYLSLFTSAQATYMILEGKKRDSTILLNGYWRTPVNTATGKVRLMITPSAGGIYITDTTTTAGGAIRVAGMYGHGDAEPAIPLQLTFARPLPSNTSFEVVAHRGGGRSSDLLPASENSVKMIRLASQFGATGIEVDVRMTKDKVPILFHDETLNERLIQKNGLVGPIANYTYDQLHTLVRLSDGQLIPTLREALHTVVYETPLRFVWLDTKFDGTMDQVRQIQQEYMQKAADIGRQLTIYIGIPDQNVLDQFLKLPNYQNIPSINELKTDKVLQTNSAYWAPQWTEGLQNDEVDRMHSLGKRVIPWTLDIPANVEDYMLRGRFDGILSNYPSTVAYYYYVNH